MADQAKERGVDFNETGPTGQAMDPTTMIEQIQSAIANKKSGIITLPASDAFGPLLQQARDAGIVTATMYGDGADGSGADINVGINWTELGKVYIDEVEKLPGDKKVGIITSADTGIGKLFMDGVKTAVAATDDIEIVGEVYTGDDSAKALAQTNALLTAHPTWTSSSPTWEPLPRVRSPPSKRRASPVRSPSSAMAPTTEARKPSKAEPSTASCSKRCATAERMHSTPSPIVWKAAPLPGARQP